MSEDMHVLKVSFDEAHMNKIRELAEDHAVIPATVVEDIVRWFLEGRLVMHKVISEGIRKRLYKLGWTRRDLAEIVGVSETTVSRWLNGKRTPRVKDAECLAIALGMTLEELSEDLGNVC